MPKGGKTCTKCRVRKPFTLFYRQTKLKDGLTPRCKSCLSRASAKWYAANKAHARSYRLANPVRRMFASARSNARKQTLAFDLGLSDIVIPALCPVLDIRLAPAAKVRTDASPSIDRIDNTKGYVRGNVAVISWRANRIKADATLAELKALVVYLENRS